MSEKSNISPILLVFARPPVKGRVKSRLAAEVGDDRALEIYLKLLDHTFSVASSSGLCVRVCWSEGGAEAPFENEIQRGNDLGERMTHAFQQALKDHTPVILIGSDCPGLQVNLIEEAIEMLKRCEVVLGPAADGGYYLVAMPAIHAELFLNIHWSTSSVLNETLIKCRELSLTVGTLMMLSDIDEWKDVITSGWIERMDKSEK